MEVRVATRQHFTSLTSYPTLFLPYHPPSTKLFSLISTTQPFPPLLHHHLESKNTHQPRHNQRRRINRHAIRTSRRRRINRLNRRARRSRRRIHERRRQRNRHGHALRGAQDRDAEIAPRPRRRGDGSGVGDVGDRAICRCRHGSLRAGGSGRRRRDERHGRGARAAGAGAGVAGITDSALGGVLICAGAFDDELDAVSCGVWFEGVGDGGPDVGASVGDVFGDGEDGDDVGGGATEEEESDAVYQRS
jgi:hypothetical protein